MPIIIRIAFVVLTIAGGAAAIHEFWPTAAAEAKQTLSPFLILSIAILIASVGYAVGNLRRK
jgi:hypothetical protein